MAENNQRLRLAMLGGGDGALIGGVHRIAARMDGRYELVAGVFAPDPAASRQFARTLDLAEERAYADYQTLLQAEAERPDGAEVVAIATPNHLHFPMALAALKAGLHVVCEKPMTLTVEEAEALARAAGESDREFLLMHNYVGYPLVQHAREMVAGGQIGKLVSVQVEYVQEWLTEEPAADNKQAAWRLDPAKAGAAGCLGDIGTHAFHLARFITGEPVAAISADLFSHVPGRQLDDNVQALLRFEGGARGSLWASQTAPGHENALRIRVIGDQASLHWQQEAPNELLYAPLNAPAQRITRRDDLLGDAVGRSIRIPGGHPEGYLEAFANLYQALADRVRTGQSAAWLPGVEAGVEGMRFVEAALQSSQADGRWTAIRPVDAEAERS